MVLGSFGLLFPLGLLVSMLPLPGVGFVPLTAFVMGGSDSGRVRRVYISGRGKVDTNFRGWGKIQAEAFRLCCLGSGMSVSGKLHLALYDQQSTLVMRGAFFGVVFLQAGAHGFAPSFSWLPSAMRMSGRGECADWNEPTNRVLWTRVEDILRRVAVVLVHVTYQC